MTWPRVARTALMITVGVLVASAQVQIWSSPPSYDEGGRPLHALLSALFTGPLLVARRWPLPVLMVVLASALADYLLGGGSLSWFAVLLALYALGSYAGPRASVAGVLATGAMTLAIDIPRLRDQAPLDEVLPGWFVLAGAWALGRWTKHRRRELASVTERADALERDRDEAARTAIAQERARIARELHDLVAHSMAVIVLQAQAAERILGTDQAAARRALAAIESTGRGGLGELRRMLALLTSAADDDLQPRPSLEHLDLLVDRVRDAGVPVSVSVAGELRQLPPGVDLSAYRIVQEALTNTLKHAGRTRARVDLTYLPEAIEIRVADEGTNGHRTTNGSEPGHGLIGMRERAALYGGRVEAGPLPGGGFGVAATLPTEAT